MGLTRDEHSVTIGDSTVVVAGRTRPIYPRWTLLVNGQDVDSANAAGDFTLRGALGDGSPVEAAVHQSLFGPTRVVITHDGIDVAHFQGFVV